MSVFSKEAFTDVQPDAQVCFVNCGLPAHCCACYRTAHPEFLDSQEPLGEDFERVWDDNIETLYGS